MTLPMHLTKKRVQALLDVADRGENDLLAYWINDCNIDIWKSDAEILRAAQREGIDSDMLSDVFDAANDYRAYRAARAILFDRYIR